MDPSWSFVGRTQELERLTTAATSPTGRGLILSGTAGVGKSRLLRQGAESLPTEQYAVWSASANIATAGLPFGGLAQVLPTDHPPGLSPAGILRWAVDALHQQAAGRPIILAIDDAHLLDPSSAALVYLIARSENCRVIGTLRTDEEVPVPIRKLWTDDLVDHIELQAMEKHDCSELLAAILKGTVDPTSAERMFRMSAGNALLLRELVFAARDSQELTQSYGVWQWTGKLELELNPSLNDLIDARIGQLTPGVRAVVELVALGEPIGQVLLNEATNPIDVEMAEERGLIRIVPHDRRQNARLAHPLYGEIVRQRCPVTRTRRLKAQLADLLDGVRAKRREDLLRLAVWRLDSGTAEDPLQMLKAAVQAFGGYDIPLATRLAQASLNLGGGFNAAELLATILMFGDQPKKALEVLDRVADQLNNDERHARWLTVRGMVSYWGLRREFIVESISKDATKLENPADRARVRAFEAIMRLHRLDCDEALRLSRAVLDRPAATPAARGVARCTIAHLQAARGELTRSGRAISGVEADAAQWRDDMPYLQLSLELARGTRLALAGDVLGIDAIVADEFADLADAGDFRLGSGYLSILRAQAARLRGLSSDALRFSTRACAALAESPVYASLAHAERAQAAALRGEIDKAVEAMVESDRLHFVGMEVLYPWREQARATVSAATGDLGKATEELVTLVRRLRKDEFAGHEVLALHDLVRLGQSDTDVSMPDDAGRRQSVAQRLTELTETVEDGLTPLVARYARAVSAGSPSELLEVAEGFAALELNLYAAEATATAVARLRESRAPGAHEANIRLGNLLGLCDVVHSPALWIRTPTLTDRERQIARLAANGAPSRHIAEQLYISPRTVENHLQRVYSKLGVTNRTELLSALRAMPAQDD